MSQVDQLRNEVHNGEQNLHEYLHRLCSEVTLWSSKEGFFSHYIKQITEQVSEDFIEKFGILKTDEERFRHIWKVKPIHTLKVQRFYKPKSREFSEKKRAEGNQAFQDKKYQQALILYSQAVMRAPHKDGSTYSLGLANRSAVLHHLKEHLRCLTDIDLALEAGYPASLTYKVLDRRGQCLLKLCKYRKAIEAFKEAFQALSYAELTEEKLEVWRKNIAKKIEMCQEKEDENEEIYTSERHRNTAYFNGSNPILPNASPAVSLKVSKDEGRYAIVNRQVPAGTVLMAERPYVSVLMENKNGFHCTHCYIRLISPVPCKWCSGVAFCSPQCRDKALATYHRWECPFLDLLVGSGVSINVSLALRAVTQHELHFFKKHKESLSEGLSLPSVSFPHRPQDYRTFYNLTAVEEHRSPQDFFQRSLVASFLLKILQRAQYFGAWDDEDSPDKSLTADEAFIGSLLLRHLQVTQFNAHEISGITFKERENNFMSTKSIFLGLAVYPTVAFCNHSCFPAVSRFFDGDKMVLVTIRPLSPGDIVAENYGPIFTHHPLQERQMKLLSRYWFGCRCEACNGNWPVYEKMSNAKTLRCLNCGHRLPNTHHNESHVKCDHCDATINVVELLEALDKALKVYESARLHMDKGDREEAISSFNTFVDAVSRVIVPPFKELHLAMQSLRLLVACRGTIITPLAK